MLPEAERYLDAARPGQNRWWRYLLGIILIACSPIVLMLALALGAYLLQGTGVGATPDGQWIVRVLTAQVIDKSILSFFVLNLSIIGMLGGLWFAIKWLHRRSFLSLITPTTRIDWRRMSLAAALTLAVLAALSLVEHMIYPGRYRMVFDAARFFPFMIAVLLLTPLQAATEELIFRGYLTQAIGHLTRNSVVVLGACTLLFAALHSSNPEVARYGWIMMAGYVLMGLMLATIAWRDGRLESAIGVHAANNVFTALISNNEGSVLQTESIFLSVLDPVFSLIAMIVMFVILHVVLFPRRTAAS